MIILCTLIISFSFCVGCYFISDGKAKKINIAIKEELLSFLKKSEWPSEIIGELRIINMLNDIGSNLKEIKDIHNPLHIMRRANYCEYQARLIIDSFKNHENKMKELKELINQIDKEL